LTGVIGRRLVDSWKIFGCWLQADGEYEVRVYGLKHHKEKRSMDHFAGLDLSPRLEGQPHSVVRDLLFAYR
jgi:hypothetical protein